MQTKFAAAEAKSSAAVSRFYGEIVRLLPWRSGGDWTEGGLDPTRPMVDFQAIVSGAVGSQNIKGDATGENFRAVATTRDRRITVDNSDWPATARVGDRIRQIQEPGQPVFEISSIVPDKINRTWANLVEISR